MAKPNTDPNSDESKITEAGAVELVERELDQAAGGGIATPGNPAAEPLSLLSKAASGKF